MADLSGLTPATSDALARLKAGLAAQGFAMGDPISGFRTYEDQRQLYANYLAGKAGQPLPFPDRGPVALAARPGYSPHESGVAFDTGLHGAALDAANRLAPSLGLATVGGDPGHFQLADWRGGQASPASNSLVASRNPTPIARPASAAAPGFMDSLAAIESGNRNIFSGTDKDYPGQPGSRSQGYFQIDTPTWRQFGAKVGIDTKQYPNAMSAPRDVQAQVAAAIPFGRFGQRTQNLMAQQFGPLNTASTIGELAGSTSPASPAAATPGTSIASLPAAAGGASGVLPGFGTKQASDDFLAGLKKAGITPDTGQGGDQGGQQPDIKPSPIMSGPGLRNSPGVAGVEAQARQLSPQLTGYSPGLYGQSLNSQPMGWGSAPIGPPAWLKGAGPQQPQGLGTSLNSLQMAGGLSPYQLQMMMNPMMLDQGGGYG